MNATIPAPLLAPVDRLRVRVLRGLGPVGRTLVAHRELRVAVSATLAVIVALATTLLVPLWALALGPIVLGVPHLLADVRYLVVRPGLHRRPVLWLAIGAPLAWCVMGAGPEAAVATIAGALLAARGSWLKRGVGLALAVPAFVLARSAGVLAVMLLLHLHNFVAVGMWVTWRRRAGRLHWLPIVLFVTCSVFLLSDAALGVVGWSGGLAAIPGLTNGHVELVRVARGLPPSLGLHLLLLFAFTQSVHYAVWLRLVPDEDRRHATTRSFARSLRALREDLGATPLLVALGVALAIAVWGAVDLIAAREGYFRLAKFHGPLELAAAVLFWIEGRPTGRRNEEASR